MTTRDRSQTWQLAECLLPGLTLSRAEELARRVSTELLGRPHRGVCFLGSLLMPGDEVLLCLFSGTAEDVRVVSERAALPFERILACVGIGWWTAAGDPPGETRTNGDHHDGRNDHANPPR